MEPNLEQGLKNLYQQTSTRRNWDNPSREEMVRSLNKAHTVNKALIKNLDEQSVELKNARLDLARERRWRKALISALISTWAAIGWMAKLMIPFAIKGMLK